MLRGFHSIHLRLFLLFLICMSSILVLVSLLFYNRATIQFHEKISDLSQKNVSQTVGLFDLLLEGYDSITKSISNNSELLRLLGQNTDQEPAVGFDNERSITNMIGAIYYSRKDLIGIHVIMDNGKIYNYGNYMNVIDPAYSSRDWYQRIQKSEGEMVWFGVYPESMLDRMEEKPVFAFGRRLYDLNKYKPIGIVLFEAKPGAIVSAVDNLRLGPNSDVYLLSDRGKVVSSSSLSPPAPDLTGITLPAKLHDVIVNQENNRLIVASKLPFADWTIVSVTPDKDLNVELTQTKRYLVVLGVILIIVSTLVAYFVSRTISLPLKRVVREMKHVEIGDFRGELNVTSYEEINLLVGSFNHMVSRIAELIERVKISSVSEKNAELHALQSQVNPHFLYNTLDMIYWMLDEKGNDKLGDVVLSLSHMFRYSSQWEEGAEVTLREEVEQIRHYLTIIVMRLEKRLTIEIEIEQRWMDIRIPKMTLQPIIENAVKHGLEPLNRQGFLRVRAVAEECNLVIVIEDNGIGMDENTLVDMQRFIQGDAPSGKRKGGIGLQNLHRRLQYMYGDDYGVQVKSVPGRGTTVMIRMPIPAAGGMINEDLDR